jgi:hypothetical protein
MALDSAANTAGVGMKRFEDFAWGFLATALFATFFVLAFPF